MPELRPYQIEDIKFLNQRKRVGCFNEQRTGKTPTALYFLNNHGCQKNLIICPASAIYSWVDEYEKWLNQLCLPLTGSRKRKYRTIQEWTHGLAVSYDSFKSTKAYDGFAKPILQAKPEGVIIDEAHRIKGRTTQAAKAAYQCRNIPYRIALTGTPSHGKPKEIFPILKWLYPKTFSSYWRFVYYFFYVYEKQGPHGAFKDIGNFKPGKEKELAQILNKFTTQRKRIEVMPWLPKEEPPIEIKIPPTDKQKKYLNELKTYFETEDIITQGILDRLIRERQICLHPGLLDLKGTSPKLDWIKDYLKDYPKKPTIFFSKFSSFLELVTKELNLPHHIITGKTSLSARKKKIEQFQNGEKTILFINIDCGKENLTLDQAESIIFTDIYPPIGDIKQAKDRFVATTEDKAHIPRRIYHLILKNTYDEQIYKNIHKLNSQADIVNDYKKYLKGE